MNKQNKLITPSLLACAMAAVFATPKAFSAEYTLSAQVTLPSSVFETANQTTYEEVAGTLRQDLIDEQMSLIDVFLASNEIECMEFWLEGFCLWLVVNITLLGIEITLDLTFDISHYNPDFVVAAYPRIGGSPLLESDVLFGAAQQTVSKAFVEVLTGRDTPALYKDEDQFGGRGADSAKKSIAMYSEVDVIGHPGNVFTLAAGGVQSTLPDVQSLAESIAGVGAAAGAQSEKIIQALESDAVVSGTVGDVDQWQNKLFRGGNTAIWEDETLLPAQSGVSQLIHVGMDALGAIRDAVTGADLLPEDTHTQLDGLTSTLSETYSLNDVPIIEAVSELESAEPSEEVVNAALSLLEESSISSTEVFSQIQSDVLALDAEQFAQQYGDALSQAQFSELLSQQAEAFEQLNLTASIPTDGSGITAATQFSFCPKDTTVLTPHYLSGLNVLSWRYQLPELAMPQSYAFPLPDSPYYVGRFGFNTIKPADSTGRLASWASKVPLPQWSTWGSVYPRSGWIAQSDEVKNRAVAAFRAAHVVTRPGQIHFYNHAQAVAPTDGMRLSHPGAMTPTDISTGAWQMIAPKNTKSCSLLHDTPIETPPGVPRDPKLTSDTGSYVYNVWRRYQCCPETSKSGFKQFLGNIPLRIKLL